MHATQSFCFLSFSAFTLAGCGGQVDVADLAHSVDGVQDRTQVPDDVPRGGNDELDAAEATATDPPQAMNGAVPVLSDEPVLGGNSEPSAGGAMLELDPECYLPEHAMWWVPGPLPSSAPLPDDGCEFEVEGDDTSCRARWACCEMVYQVTFSVKDLGGETFATTDWWLSGGGSGGSAAPYAGEGSTGTATPYDGQTCPFLGEDAASVASQGFGYTPAWQLAVSEARGEDPPELDPTPVGCEYEVLEVACSATLRCAEHDYTAGFDDEGELVCTRDGEAVEPRLPALVAACQPDFFAQPPAEACFGAGWNRHFAFVSPE